MASSGVWENVILANPPRCDGVYKIFSLIILILIMADVIAIIVGRCFYPF